MMVREDGGFEEGGGEEVYLRPCGEAQEGFAYSSSVSLEFGYLLFNGPKVLSWSHRMVWEGVDSKR